MIGTAADLYYQVYRYYTPERKPQTLGFVPNIVDVLTRLEAPFNCTAQIRVTLSEFLKTLRPGDEIRGVFGKTERHMRIDSIQYNDVVNTCVIYCVQTDMWIYSHRIAFDYAKFTALAEVGLTQYMYWRKTTFQEKIRILYGLSLTPKQLSPPNIPFDDFPDGGTTNRLPPLLGEPLKDWKPAAIQTSFFIQLTTVRDVMGSVVDLYKPAWDADTTIQFYPPWKHKLSKDVVMIRFISHGQSAVPTIGYGHGGQGWRIKRQNEPTKPTPYGMEYELIYDISDEYDNDTLEELTALSLDADQSAGEWWEVELLNDHEQKLWVGDTVIGDFIGPGKEAVITRITYDQIPERTRTFLHLGKAPATVTDRLNAMRIAARRDIELTWMKGLTPKLEDIPSLIRKELEKQVTVPTTQGKQEKG